MLETLQQPCRDLITPVPPRGSDRGTRLHSHLFNFALQLWLVFTFALTVKITIDENSHSSYPTYEYGARRWWRDMDMYWPGPPFTYDYRYGPAFAVAMTPFVALPTVFGAMLFAWTTIAAFFLMLREVIRQLFPGPWTARRQGIFMLLALATTGRMFWALQVNPMIFAAVAMAAVAIKNRRWWLASFLLAAAVHVKIWPLAAAMLMIACWPRQLSWRFVLAMLIVGAAPFLTRPPQMVISQYQWWFDVLVGRAQVRHMYRDAWTILELLNSGLSAHGYVLVQLASAGLTLVACLWQKRRSSDITQTLTFIVAIWTAWQMVFGVATEPNTFGLIGPPACWAIITAWEQCRHHIWMSVAFLLMTVLSIGQVERFLSPSFPWIETAHPIGSALFAAWLIEYARQHWRGGELSLGGPLEEANLGS